MSAAESNPADDAPSIPWPARTAEELRSALAQVAPAALSTFDAERAAALQQARD